MNYNKLPIQYEIYKKAFSLTEPKISPDGTRLAYILKHDSFNTLFILNIENNISKPLIWKPDVYAGFVGSYAWSADSSFIVYRSKKGHLFKIFTENGLSKQLTFDDKKAQTPQISHDNKITLYVADGLHRSYLAYVGTDGKSWAQDIGVRWDFIQDPVLSPDNLFYTFMGYNNPFMPWDKSYIIVGEINGKVKSIINEQIEGEAYSVSQPRWSPKGNYLTFISDRSGYYNLWAVDKSVDKPYNLIPLDNDMIKPSWGSGNVDYVWSGDESYIVFTMIDKAKNNLYRYDMKTRKVEQITDNGGFYSFINLKKDKVYCLHESSTKPADLIEIDINDRKERTLISTSFMGMDSYALSSPEHVEWVNKDSKLIYGLFYPAMNPKIEPAPLLVYVHGGPTDLIMDRWNIRIQYFVSRGWNVFAVNYRGSGGYGRKYRQCLNGYWGVYDVEDCKSGVEYLINKGKARKDCIAILGGSAGGYTTLMSLANYPEFYKAGVSLYGVTDLYELSLSTHRLEAHYNDQLIGDMYEDRDRYYLRSPLSIAERIKSPLLLLQGDKDKVVSKEQADYLISKLKDREGFHYKFFEGEGHGFSKDNEGEALRLALEFLNKYVIYR